MSTGNADCWFDPQATTFGDRVAGARERAGMTQEILAHRLGVKIKTLKDWEDDLSEPRANRLSMMSGLLNVSLRWLITGEGEDPGGPSDQLRVSRGATALMAEMRDLKMQVLQTSERIARLEGNLRDVLKGELVE